MTKVVGVWANLLFAFASMPVHIYKLYLSIAAHISMMHVVGA